jgi:hypothetical protein
MMDELEDRHEGGGQGRKNRLNKTGGKVAFVQVGAEEPYITPT